MRHRLRIYLFKLKIAIQKWLILKIAGGDMVMINAVIKGTLDQTGVKSGLVSGCTFIGEKA